MQPYVPFLGEERVINDSFAVSTRRRRRANVLRGFAFFGALGSAAGIVVVAWHVKWRLSTLLTSPLWSTLSVGLIALMVLLLICIIGTIPCASGAHAAALDRATLLSRAMFMWVLPTLSAATKHSSLELHHLPKLPIADGPERLYKKFARVLKKRGGGRALSAVRLMRTLFFTTQFSVALQCCVAGWIFLVCMFADPTLLHLLLGSQSVSGAQAEGFVGYMPTLRHLCLAVLLSCSMLLRTTCMELCFFASTRLANNARAQLIVGVFRSSLSNAARGKRQATGRLTNLLATDADGIGNAMSFMWSFGQWIFSLCALPAVIYMMWSLLGNAAFVGAAAFVLSQLVAAAFSWVQKAVVTRLQECRDVRGDAMHGVVQGIGVLKAYGCEAAWAQRVHEARERELRQLRNLRYLSAAVGLVTGLFQQAAPVAIFSWYVLVQKRALDASTAFTALAWIYQMQWSISALPDLFLQAMYLLPMLRRLADAVAPSAQGGSQGGSGGGGGGMMGGGAASSYAVAKVDDVTPRQTEQSALDALVDDIGYGTPSSINGEGGGSINGTPTRPVASGGGGGAAASGTAPLVWTGGGGGGAQSNNAADADQPPLPPPGSAFWLPPPGTALCLRRAKLQGAPDARTEEEEERMRFGLWPPQQQQQPRQREYAEVELTIGSNELLLVCGAIGSGKSTLLAALSQARPLLSGSASCTPSRAYCAQTPFLLRASVRENILFGRPYEAQRYAEALKLAALEVDIRQLAEGDQTNVGEAGLRLSSGQRARVAFARAVYSDADALILDDVFAAVDAHTGTLLWETLKLLVLVRGKTVVVATHQMQLLSRPEVSRIALMRDGELSACAAPTEPKMALQLRGYMAAAAAMQQAGKLPRASSLNSLTGAGNGNGGGGSAAAASSGGGGGGGGGGSGGGLSLAAAERLFRSTLRRFEGQQINRRLIQKACESLHGGSGGSGGSGDGSSSSAQGGGGGGATSGGVGREDDSAETVREGLITWADFRTYLAVFGSTPALVLLALTTILSALSSIAANVFLSEWTSGFNETATPTSHADPAQQADDRDRYSLLIYVAIGAATELLLAIQTVLLTVCSLRASRRLHAKLVEAMLHAPLSFYDSTTTGAVLNRCLSDIQSIDVNVPNSLVSLAGQVLQMLTQVGLVLYVVPWVALVLPPLLVLYGKIYKRMRFAARDVRRLSSRLHSPVFAHFADVLSGAETIAAYGLEERFCEGNLERVTAMSRASISVAAVLKWGQALSVQSGSLLYFACAVACVLLAAFDQITTSQVGLVLLYANNLQRASMDLMMRLAELETEFVAVERVAEYCRLESEREEDEEGRKRMHRLAALQDGDDGAAAFEAQTLSVGTDADFYTRALMGSPEPMRGALELRDVVVRYAPHKPPAVNGVTVSIPPSSKVACVGRSGSGKSTLLRSLARLYPLDGGAIRIDGIDLSAVELSEVRSVVRFVAPEPVLLDGTLLANLLAFESQERMTRATDAGECGNASTVAESEAWDALEQLGLRQRIESLPRGLKTHVKSADLSAGELQLFSLCRALVAGRGTKALRVLLCDEPTSALDMASDKRVHDVLTSISATVVVVAHRLQSITRFDRALVLAKGTLVEDGEPNELLERPGTILGQMKRNQDAQEAQESGAPPPGVAQAQAGSVGGEQ